MEFNSLGGFFGESVVVAFCYSSLYMKMLINLWYLGLCIVSLTIWLTEFKNGYRLDPVIPLHIPSI